MIAPTNILKIGATANGTFYDVATLYGASIAEGTYKAVLQWPQMKTPESNDWAEEDGLEYDFDTLHYQSRTLQLTLWFADEGGTSGSCDEFVAWLTEAATRYYRFVELSRTYQLRLKGVSSYTDYDGLKKIVLSLAEPQPLALTQSGNTARMSYADTGIVLKGTISGTAFTKDLAKFDCRTLNGTDQLGVRGEFKENVTYTSKFIDGEVYSDNPTFAVGDTRSRRKTGTFKVQLLMRSDTTAHLLTNFDALQKHCFYARAIQMDGKEYGAFYQSMQVMDFAIPDWLNFTITFTLTGEQTEL